MRLTLTSWFLIACMAGLSCGCSKVDPEVQAGLQGFLSALEYGDVKGALRHHVEGSASSRWCGMGKFRSMLEQLKARKSPKVCGELEGLGKGGVKEGLEDDEALFLAQTMRFVCESESAQCTEYAVRVFTSAFEQAKFFEPGATKHKVNKVQVEGGVARAYVQSVGPSVQGAKRTLTMVKTPLGWRVSTPLSDLVVGQKQESN